MSYYPPYDPARAAYYAHPPPAGYPGSPNGYGPPHSPSSQPPRPHTTAPYPAPSQFAPPPGQALYYGLPPPPGPEHGVHALPPAPAPAPAPAPPPPASAYPPQSPSGASDSPFGNMSPEQLQGMIDQLKNLKNAKASPAPAPAAPVARADQVSPPRINTAMPQGQPPPPAPQSARGPPISQPYPYPSYAYYNRPASHSGEVSPPPAPAPPHGYPAPPKTPGPMPGSFYPEALAPPAPAPLSKAKAPAPAPAPAPTPRPEPSRKPSEQASEISFGSSKSHDMAHAWEQWGGPLVEVAPGREPRPKPKLVSLFRGIAAYMIALLEPTQSCVVTLNKLVQFYATFPAGAENESHEWQRFFDLRSPKVLSELFCALNVEHHLVPTKPNQAPSLPGLTPRGFEVWMFTQLMTAPTREWHRISKILDHWTIFEMGVEMPKIIPRECFPQVEDRAIYGGWWQAVREDYPEEDLDSDDDRKVPLGLPEPRRRGYSIRNGDTPHDTGDESKSSPPTPPSVRSAPKPQQQQPKTYRVPDPNEFLTPEEKDNAPVERFHKSYGAPPPPRSEWRDDRREEINPRPTLGEEPPRPPTRARSVKDPKASSTKDSGARRPAPAPAPPAAPASKRGRSAHRKRDESPDTRYQSDEEFDDRDGYGRRYEGDGLYEDPSPPRTTTPHHPSYHNREPSRGPPSTASRKHAPAPPPSSSAAAAAEKDIREYTYQDQYEKDYAPTVNAAGRRPHRGSDAQAPYHQSSATKRSWR